MRTFFFKQPGPFLKRDNKIKTPVAINSMIKKLDKGEYASVEDLEEDFETMVKNAKTYNEEGSSVITDALALLVWFLFILLSFKCGTHPLGKRRTFMKSLEKNQPHLLLGPKDICPPWIISHTREKHTNLVGYLNA